MSVRSAGGSRPYAPSNVPGTILQTSIGRNTSDSRSPYRLDYKPTLGTKLVGIFCGAQLTYIQPTSWSTLSGSATDSNYQSGAVFNTTTTSRNTVFCTPGNLSTTNASVGVLIEANVTSVSAFRSGVNATGQTSFTFNVPATSANALIRVLVGYDQTYTTIASVSANATVISPDCGAGDDATNHGAALLAVNPSTSAQTVTITWTTAISYPAAIGVVFTP